MLIKVVGLENKVVEMDENGKFLFEFVMGMYNLEILLVDYVIELWFNVVVIFGNV